MISGSTSAEPKSSASEVAPLKVGRFSCSTPPRNEYKNTLIQKYTNTKIQKYKNTKIHKYKICCSTAPLRKKLKCIQKVVSRKVNYANRKSEVWFKHRKLHNWYTRKCTYLLIIQCMYNNWPSQFCLEWNIVPFCYKIRNITQQCGQALVFSTICGCLL